MTQHRRILLLITDLEIGGTPTVVRELAVRLREPGTVHVEVACLSEWGPVADQLKEAGVHVTALGARGARDLPRTVHRLDQLIGGRLIDTCFSFLVHANVVAAIASRFKREVRYLQSVQTTQPEPRWHWTAGRFAHHAAERVVVPSESVAHAVRSWSGVPGEKVVVIPNAIEMGEFENIPREPSPAGKYRVGFIGRLDPIKRIPDLVRAIALLPADVELHVYGEGGERGRIEEEIRRAKVADRVVMHGAVARPQEALGKMDVLVLPSEAEGFGLVLIEAMAAGVPVVATNVPGIRDVVKDGSTGVLVPMGSPADLAGGIEQVRADDSLRRRMIEAGREEVRQRFSWEGVMREYRRVLAIPTTGAG